MKRHRKQRSARGWARNPLTWIVIGGRIGAALSIFVQPFFGMLVSFLFDWLDALVLIQMVRYSRKDYHRLDKFLDQLWSLVMVLVGFRTEYGALLLSLYMYRLIGYAVYVRTGQTRVYVWFPNVFEFVFFWYAAIAPLLGVGAQAVSVWVVFSACLVLKEIQEYVLHIWWPVRLERFRKTGYPPMLQAFGWHRVG